MDWDWGSSNNSCRIFSNGFNWELTNVFQKTKSFCFENCVFHFHGKCMSEGVSEDSRHGMGM